MAVEEKGKVTK